MRKHHPELNWPYVRRASCWILRPHHLHGSPQDGRAEEESEAVNQLTVSKSSRLMATDELSSPLVSGCSVPDPEYALLTVLPKLPPPAMPVAVAATPVSPLPPASGLRGKLGLLEAAFLKALAIALVLLVALEHPPAAARAASVFFL